jgi:hypothetical protein
LSRRFFICPAEIRWTENPEDGLGGGTVVLEEGSRDWFGEAAVWLHDCWRPKEKEELEERIGRLKL